MILTFQSVRSAATPDYECALDDVSFSLAPGNLLLLRVESPNQTDPIADLACGIHAPDSGTVTVAGSDWQRADPATAASLRGTIGRVFAAGAWLSNLDVDENITLARRYHTHQPEIEILEAARRLARAFGLDDLPAGRPNTVPRATLRRAQWIRALLGEPRLLLLEHPTQESEPRHRAAFREAITAARHAGAAVIWVTAETADATDPALNPTLIFDLIETKMVPRPK